AAERLRAAVAALKTQVGGVMVRITVSIGVAQSTGEDRLDDAIARADAALYVAKQSGRNQVAA
ncbi:MAG TPA: diguanylate cyclase, partial [Azospirillaceae bacterium]|nr:diguanylate cyclase [Azospirillaceae bacterium]